MISSSQDGILVMIPFLLRLKHPLCRNRERQASCPLWVISGHVRLREKASAFLPKADIIGPVACLLSANSGHSKNHPGRAIDTMLSVALAPVMEGLQHGPKGSALFGEVVLIARWVDLI
jgi:hypothetical protein